MIMTFSRWKTKQSIRLFFGMGSATDAVDLRRSGTQMSIKFLWLEFPEIAFQENKISS